MKIYTKTGDEGKTSLFGGDRVWKNDLRIGAYGTVDELNALLGVAVTEIKNEKIKEIVNQIQNQLFTVGADLATPFDKGNKNFEIPRVESIFYEKLENYIDKIESELPELKQFILPGGTKGAALLHYGRTVCRRAERKVIELSKTEEITKELIVYLNRLSDLLFILARFENYSLKHPEIKWQK